MDCNGSPGRAGSRQVLHTAVRCFKVARLLPFSEHLRGACYHIDELQQSIMQTGWVHSMLTMHLGANAGLMLPSAFCLVSRGVTSCVQKLGITVCFYTAAVLRLMSASLQTLNIY